MEKEKEQEQEMVIEGDVSLEEREVFVLVQAALGDNPTLERCAEQFFLIKRCWNDYDECLRQNMTFERASHTLREIRDSSNGKTRGNLLSVRADKLLWEIVNHSAIVPELDVAEAVMA